MNLLQSLKIFFMSAFGLCLTLVIIPVIVPPLLLFLVWYFAFKLILKILYGNDVYKASGTDVVHGRQTAQCLPVINAAVRVDGPLNLDLMKERMGNMIENAVNENGQKRYKRLKELYVKKFGYNVWKKFDQFNINDHILQVQPSDVIKQNNEQSSLIYESRNENNSEYGLDPLSNYYNESQLNNNINQRVEQGHQSAIPNGQNKEEPNPEVPWDVTLKNFLNAFGGQEFEEGLPPWNILVLDERNGKYTAVFRFHHAISDGIYLARMFSEDILDESCRVFQSYQPPSKFVKYLTLCWSFCLLPFGLLEMMTKHDRNPLHGVGPLTGRKVFFISNCLSLETFQSIRKKIRVSLHTIAFSCISAAVSSHFLRRGTNVDTVTVLSPVPLQNPHNQVQMKNKFAVSATALPTLSEAKLLKKSGRRPLEIEECYYDQICNFNSLERLARVKVSIDKTNSNPAILVVNNLITLFCSLLPEKLAQALLSVKGCTMAVSNMPGSKVESKAWNGTQVDQLFWIPVRDPMGVGFSILSYNGNLRFGLVVDDALLKDEKEGDAIMRDIEIELKNIARELKEADLSTFPGLKEVV